MIENKDLPRILRGNMSINRAEQNWPEETEAAPQSKREQSIVHENGDYWVSNSNGQYTVYCAGITHSKADSSYSSDADGLSIAIARCDYLARRAAQIV